MNTDKQQGGEAAPTQVPIRPLPDQPTAPTCVPGEDDRPPKSATTKPTGRQYSSVEEMMSDATPATPEGGTPDEGDPELSEDFAALYKKFVARGDVIRALERELVAVQLRKIDACVAWTVAQDELSALRTLLATAEKERDEARSSLTQIFRWWDMKDGHLLTHFPTSVSKQMESLRLTPSASQSAEMGKRVAAAAKEQARLIESFDPKLGGVGLEASFTGILSRHFTTPTQ